MTKLLHIEKFMPRNVINSVINIQKKMSTEKITFSKHIQDHFTGGNHKHDYTKEGVLRCLEELKDSPQEPFEVELTLENGKTWITKYVIRTPYDEEYDISIAVRGRKVVTAWLNHRTDTHKTLNLSKYSSSI